MESIAKPEFTLVPSFKSFIDLVLEYSSLTQHEKLELMVLGVLGATDMIYFWVLSQVPFPCILRAALLSWFLGGLGVNVDIGKWMSSLVVVFSQYHLTLWILLQFHMNLKKQLDTCYKEASSGSDSYCIKAVGLLENSAILTISSLLVKWIWECFLSVLVIFNSCSNDLNFQSMGFFLLREGLPLSPRLAWNWDSSVCLSRVGVTDMPSCICLRGYGTMFVNLSILFSKNIFLDGSGS